MGLFRHVSAVTVRLNWTANVEEGVSSVGLRISVLSVFGVDVGIPLVAIVSGMECQMQALPLFSEEQEKPWDADRKDGDGLKRMVSTRVQGFPGFRRSSTAEAPHRQPKG